MLTKRQTLPASRALKAVGVRAPGGDAAERADWQPTRAPQVYIVAPGEASRDDERPAYGEQRRASCDSVVDGGLCGGVVL